MQPCGELRGNFVFVELYSYQDILLFSPILQAMTFPWLESFRRWWVLSYLYDGQCRATCFHSFFLFHCCLCFSSSLLQQLQTAGPHPAEESIQEHACVNKQVKSGLTSNYVFCAKQSAKMYNVTDVSRIKLCNWSIQMY